MKRKFVILWLLGVGLLVFAALLPHTHVYKKHFHPKALDYMENITPYPY
jgi:hypothetical protein